MDYVKLYIDCAGEDIRPYTNRKQRPKKGIKNGEFDTEHVGMY